jgi:phage tail protein X
MTRETKVGLLMGLGFVVIFAVLLSYTGPRLSPAQSVPSMVAQPKEDELLPPPGSRLTGGQPDSWFEDGINRQTPPAPGPEPSIDSGPAGEWAEEVPPAWPLQGPQPGTRPSIPESIPPPRTYVVRRGENLEKIARIVYGESSPAIISHIVNANPGTIKDRNSLRAGQTILTPPLPAELIKRTTAAR